VITGNPAFRDRDALKEKPGCAAVAARLKSPRQKVITCISQNFSDQAQYSMISAFCRSVAQLDDDWLGVVKAHPADNTGQLNNLVKDYPGVLLLDKSVPLEQVLEANDLFMVVNSNVAFDAVLAGKPVFFWHIDEERSGLAGIFAEEAEAVIVKDETALTALLSRCAANGIGAEIHAGALTAFAGAFCAYTGEEAARVTRTYLISD
jgi:CDP-glycerol glycerophosphotransferase (TagB/SpsB family)